MAADTAQSSRWLAALPVAAIGLPVLPGLALALEPGFGPEAWSSLLASKDAWGGFWLMLWTAMASTALALILALAMYSALLAGGLANRLVGLLPAWLAIPHVAFGVGFAMLVAPSGLLVRLVAMPAGWDAPPAYAFPQDAAGLGLIAALAIKESIFLLWLLIGSSKSGLFQRRLVTARSLGYGPAQSFVSVVLPDALRQLAWPLAAVLSYGLSVVDLALVLGPGNPPTFAVSVWRWLNDPDPAIAAKGSAGALVLMVVLGLLIGLAAIVQRAAGRFKNVPAGRRNKAGLGIGSVLQCVIALLFAVVLMVLALWSVSSGWFFPALLPAGLSLSAWVKAGVSPFAITLAAGLASAALAVIIAFVWLEFGPKKGAALLLLPLVLPVLPLAIGQYRVILALGLEGSFVGLVWSHLFWVMPYVALSLSGPHEALDPRHRIMAASLGKGRLATAFGVTAPMLVIPLLVAFSVGFSVSVAQYLPTLYAGSGRFATVTTEAVVLSAGGNRQVLAVQALLQALLPLALFGLTALLSNRIAINRKGLA